VIVVADAGPLIHLSLVGKLELLPLLYGRILIPDLVYQEVVQKGEGLAGSTEIRTADWVDIIPHDSAAHLFRLLRAEIDPGEAAAIWLAVEQQAEWVLSDDRQARWSAERLGFKVRGTLGILAEAKRRGLLSRIAPFLHELKAQGVWLSEGLIEKVLRSLGESDG
jgi:uncharacterized protein